MSSVSSSSTSEPFVKTSHSRKQLDFHGSPSIVTLCAGGVSGARARRKGQPTISTFTKTWPPVPFLGLPWKPFARMVVVVFKTGLRKEISGK